MRVGRRQALNILDIELLDGVGLFLTDKHVILVCRQALYLEVLISN